MTDRELTEFLNKKVEIKFSDNTTYIGVFGKGDFKRVEEWLGNGYHLTKITDFDGNLYYLGDMCFKKSHIKKIKLVGEINDYNND